MLNESTQEMLNDLIAATLTPLLSYFEKNPAFVLTYLNRLNDDTLSLADFKSQLNKAAANKDRHYDLYKALYELKKFLADVEYRKKLLSALGTYSEELDTAAVNHIKNSLIQKTPAVSSDSEKNMDDYAQEEKNAESNSAWFVQNEEALQQQQIQEDNMHLMFGRFFQPTDPEPKTNPAPKIEVEFNSQHYHHNPQAFNVVDLFDDIMASLQLSTSGEKSVFPWYFAPIFRANPAQLDQWIAKFNLTSFVAKENLCAALWQTNTAQAHHQLTLLGKKQGFDKLVKQVKKTKLINIETCLLDSPAMLDRGWAHFHASGSKVILQNLILRAVNRNFSDLKPDGQDVQLLDPLEFATTMAAKWSVSSHLKSDSIALAIAEEFTKKLSRSVRAEVQLLIDGAVGKKSTLSSFGMTPTVHLDAEMQNKLVKDDLKRITGFEFKLKTESDSTKLFWTQLHDPTDFEKAQAVKDYLLDHQLAKEVTVRIAEGTRKPVIIAKEINVDMLTSCAPMEVVTGPK